MQQSVRDAKKQFYSYGVMKMHKKHTLKTINGLFLIVLIGMNLISLSKAETNIVEGNGTSQISGNLTSTSMQRWEDTAWIFLSTEVPNQDLLVLKLN